MDHRMGKYRFLDLRVWCRMRMVLCNSTCQPVTDAIDRTGYTWNT